MSPSFACRSEGTSKDPISLHAPGGSKCGGDPKCTPAERLPDGCLTFLLESLDSLQIFIRAGANKVSRLSRKSGLQSRFDVRSQVRQPLNGNGGEGWRRCEPGEDERRGVVDRGSAGRGKAAFWKARAAKHGSWCRTSEVEGRLKRRLRQ